MGQTTTITKAPELAVAGSSVTTRNTFHALVQPGTEPSAAQHAEIAI